MDATQIGAMLVLVIASILLGMIAAGLLLGLFVTACEAVEERQRAKADATLDAQSEEVRQTILSLAESLAVDKDEATKAMTRAIFLTTGRVAEPVV
ncbi:hypothetical protein [Microbacterium sp.]|uniref:hypothetical protein n=1 Tax=Microbacterium sp. TaxID=51671 RepID=UPI001AC675BF|nr:hypothetical protein [Microbacterium sp.]MBN9156925.1 hypothetical protein [Microbacterium sp.]